MPIERTDTLIVGGGQAGLAMSEHLGKAGVEHLILEKGRVAERWRSGRWDSLVANGPAWHDRFPGLEFGSDPDAFVPKEEVADYFVAYADMISAPVRCGVEVLDARRLKGRPVFRVETSQGALEARRIVVATGPFQTPVIPDVIPQNAGVRQLHSAEYRNPAQLSEGAVMVVGAGSSGAQIADELQRSGRRVYLSVGPHDRPPRIYRGRDYCWWLGVLGKWETAALEPGKEHVTISVSGAYGGQTVDFRRLASEGMILTGRTTGFQDGALQFAPDLVDNIAQGDANYLSVLDEADAYIVRNGLDVPEEPEARTIWPDPECMIHPLNELNLQGAGISTVLWATGYSSDYRWLKADTFDHNGRPLHQRGVSPQEGIYFLGLPWQSRRGSSFIWGVWHDARYLADQITIQRNYHAYRPLIAQKDA